MNFPSNPGLLQTLVGVDQCGKWLTDFYGLSHVTVNQNADPVVNRVTGTSSPRSEEKRSLSNPQRIAAPNDARLFGLKNPPLALASLQWSVEVAPLRLHHRPEDPISSAIVQNLCCCLRITSQSADQVTECCGPSTLETIDALLHFQ